MANTFKPQSGGSSAAALTVPTTTIINAQGSQTGWLFTISTSSTCSVGDTYTNNSNTYTVEYALSAQSGQVLFMSGTGTTSGTTLTRSAGSGTSSITFSTKIATAHYQVPASGPLYLEVMAVGGGGGGGGVGSSIVSGSAGTDTFFGGLAIDAGAGQGGTGSEALPNMGSGGSGGGVSVAALSNTLNSGSKVVQVLAKQGNSGGNGAPTSDGNPGGFGGSSVLGGGQTAGPTGAGGGNSALNNTGGGGSGACGSLSGVGTTASGGGGGGGGSIIAIISGVAASQNIPYVLGQGGGGGSGSINTGGSGATGFISVKEYYQ